MNKDITIIVPTKGRQNYLNRVARYYSDFDMQTYICDAYQTACVVDNYDNILYEWNPDQGFFEEILNVIKRTESKFYLLSPDDDFIKYESLISAYNTMLNNKHIALSTGKQAFFSEEFDGEFIHYKSHNRICDEQINFINSADYNSFWNNYQNIHWSLFTRECAIEALSKLDHARFNYACFAEFIFGIEALRHGGIFFHNDYFNYRELSSKPHWGSVAPSISWKNLIASPELRSDIRKLGKLYGKDVYFVYRCLFAYLGNPIMKFAHRLRLKLIHTPPIMEKSFSDDVMSGRIKDALSKVVN